MTPEKQKSKHKLLLVALLALFALAAIGKSLLIPSTRVAGNAPFVPPRGTVAYSEQIDFQQAMKKSYTPDTKPEDNGFRDILSVFGRTIFNEIPDENWQYLCKELEWNPDEQSNVIYVSLRDFLRDELKKTEEKGMDEKILNGKVSDILFSFDKPEVEEANLRLLEQWIKATDPAFVAMVEALKKPGYFLPPTFSEGRPDLTHSAFAQRELARMCQYRQNLHTRTGDAEKAYEDVYTAFLLTRKYYSQPFVNSTVFAVAFERAAVASFIDVLKSGLLSEEQLRQCLTDLERLPERGKLEDKLASERLGVLQCISEFPEKGAKTFRIAPSDESLLPPVGFEKEKEALKTGVDNWLRIYRKLPFDWNLVAEVFNAEFDKLEGKETKQTFEQTIPEDLTFGVLQKMSQKERSIVLGKVFFESYAPKPNQYEQIINEAENSVNLAKVAIGLELYKKSAGQYPASLDLLLEKGILDNIPNDLYRKPDPGPFSYRCETPEQYILYSFGPNGEDNGGKRWTSIPPDDRAWDDVVVEMP